MLVHSRSHRTIKIVFVLFHSFTAPLVVPNFLLFLTLRNSFLLHFECWKLRVCIYLWLSFFVQALQQREIEDEIAVCDKKIQRMLTGMFSRHCGLSLLFFALLLWCIILSVQFLLSPFTQTYKLLLLKNRFYYEKTVVWVRLNTRTILMKFCY